VLFTRHLEIKVCGFDAASRFDEPEFRRLMLHTWVGSSLFMAPEAYDHRRLAKSRFVPSRQSSGDSIAPVSGASAVSAPVSGDPPVEAGDGEREKKSGPDGAIDRGGIQKIAGSPPTQESSTDYDRVLVDVWGCGLILFSMVSKIDAFSYPVRSCPRFKALEHGRYEEFWTSVKEESKVEVDAKAKDLIVKILQINPSKRPQLSEILAHPWLTDSHAKPDQLAAELARRFDTMYGAKWKERREEMLRPSFEYSPAPLPLR